ncbi:methylenetetrahydrofolate reductase [endosymbiont 'TC1' of Trimyema compressum]|uniref:methylenetetrahydrofolate reductase n=1 Tax=endosymbiont 'TC1' of Trimyema compressum TaxID=243899 RepID=UPI00316ABE89
MPKKFIRILDKYKDNPAALKEAGIMCAIDQIIDLVTSGVKEIHIYSMNRPDVTAKIMENIPNILDHKELIS